MRHSKISGYKIVLEGVQNRDWQYLVESVIRLAESNKSQFKPLPGNDEKIIKSMKHNYKVARRDYSSIYIKIAEQSKIYTNSLPPDEIDEIENDFRANGNGLLSVQDTESTTDLFDSFAMFYYINSRLPYTTGLHFVPDSEMPAGIQGEKLNAKVLFAKFFPSKSNGLVSAPFLGALLLYFLRKRKPWSRTSS